MTVDAILFAILALQRGNMGAWSVDPFGNDDALDWASELLEDSEADLIDETFNAVLATEGTYLEAPEASRGIAACGVVAELREPGCLSSELPDDIKLWLPAHPQLPDDALATKARLVIARVTADGSELNELWTESEDAELWNSTLGRLAAALN